MSQLLMSFVVLLMWDMTNDAEIEGHTSVSGE